MNIGEVTGSIQTMINRMAGYVYILQSQKSGRYYIGSTADAERRLVEHNRGQTKATRYLRPWTLKFWQQYDTLATARKVEQRLKRYKSRVIIEKIIADGEIKGP